MEDKLSNMLIVIILIIVIGLAGIYIYKMSNENTEILNISTNIIQEDTIKEENTTMENDIQEETNKTVEEQTVVIIPATDSSSQTITQNQNTEATSTYAYNDRYYYKQLDSYSKIIYDSIANNIGNLKYGSYVINVNEDFSSLLTLSDGQNRLKEYYDDAINAINLDIPNLFYVDFSKMCLNIETTTNVFGVQYKLYIDSGGHNTYFSSSFTSQSQIESAINAVEKVKNDVCNQANGSDYNKIRTTHDWLIEYLSYDTSSNNRGNIYGAFIEKAVVCEGYSRTYKYILDNLGISNILVTGKATNSNGVTEEHMWNYVKLDGTWYAIDPTWDDPIVYGGGTVSSGTKHKYFLIGSTELFKTHVESKTISFTEKIFTLPTLSTSNY